MKNIQEPVENKENFYHYDLVRNYFKNKKDIKKGYLKKIKSKSKQRKIFDLILKNLQYLINEDSKLLKIIDAGCGMGDFTFELYQNFTQFEQIIGIDFLKEIINSANNKYKKIKKIYFLQADLIKTPFNDRFFDVTVCIDVLHHIHKNDLKSTIIELMRITEKFLILEIRNEKNIFNLWYSYIIQPIFYRSLPIYPTSIAEINSYCKDYCFNLKLARRIASSRYSCRRLVLIYKRNN